MTWNDSDRVLETPRGLAGEHGADFVGLKPGGACHVSLNIFLSICMYMYFCSGQSEEKNMILLMEITPCTQPWSTERVCGWGKTERGEDEFSEA